MVTIFQGLKLLIARNIKDVCCFSDALGKKPPTSYT